MSRRASAKRSTEDLNRRTQRRRQVGGWMNHGERAILRPFVFPLERRIRGQSAFSHEQKQVLAVPALDVAVVPDPFPQAVDDDEASCRKPFLPVFRPLLVDMTRPRLERNRSGEGDAIAERGEIV